MPHLPVSRLVAGTYASHVARGNAYQVLRYEVQQGVELLSWRGHFEQPLDLALCDDSERVNFSFNCHLHGRATCEFDDGVGRAFDVQACSGNISYGPGRKGRYRQLGTLHNLTVAVHPDRLRDWDGRALKRLLAAGGYATGHRSPELVAAASWVSRTLHAHGANATPAARHRLWLQGQAMTLVGLFLEAHPGAVNAPEDDARIQRARDFLLADLSQAPLLAELATVAGISEPTLTRQFRRQFGESPYGLFQKERMHAARARLLSERVSIATLAADLGYTNASHFTAAFRQQFGIAPRDLKRAK
ncbi:hypothetical protein A9762_06770 [Pandoraea sp. ISTKB]|nr:hypothetical protein A9762_06770 [Pandoraea sp. ISTKB]